MKSQSHLAKSFYRRFLLLIVLPILLILVAALLVARSMMLKASIGNIRLMHTNVASALESEITDASLSLAHYLQSNDNRMLELITRYFKSASQVDKYLAITELNEAYNVMFQPKSQIIAIQFVMKSGEQYCLKDDVVFSADDLRQNEWYQDARNKPDQVFISLFDQGVTYATRGSYGRGVPIVAAYAPQRSDRGGDVEMVCLYIRSRAPTLLEKYNSQPEITGMFLIDASGKPIRSALEADRTDQMLSALSSTGDGESRRIVAGEDAYCIVTTLSKHPIRIASVSGIPIMLRDFNRLSVLVIAVACLVFLMFFIFSRIFLSGIIRPVDRLNAGMQRVQGGDLSFAVEESGQKELRELTVNFNRMTGRIQELLETTRKQEEEKHRAEMRALQSQINPHFLVNTLNTMRFMSIVAKFDGLKNMSDALIKILSCLFKSQSSFYTVGEEIDILKSYTYLMGIRYSDNFEVEFDIADEVMDCMVPCLMLQPIVENAITHGLAAKEEIGHIRVAAERWGGTLIFTVRDDGIGMTEERMAEVMSRAPEDAGPGIGIGVSNVNRRIQLLYGGAYGIQMTSAPEAGTTTVLKIPARRAIPDDHTDSDRG